MSNLKSKKVFKFTQIFYANMGVKELFESFNGVKAVPNNEDAININ